LGLGSAILRSAILGIGILGIAILGIAILGIAMARPQLRATVRMLVMGRQPYEKV
jgi:hypothetical protein